MARRHLRIGAKEELVDMMKTRLVEERKKVKGMVVEEIESLMRLGAEVTGMTYECKSTGTRRMCVTPKDIRSSFIQEGDDMNVKRIHWIFHELPYGTHEDVLTQRMSHMNWVVQRVVNEMNVQWEPKKEGETVAHKNCIEHTYTRFLNEKKSTIIGKVKGGDAGGLHRKPFVRSPKTLAAALGAAHFKRGKKMYFWESKAEGIHVVSENL
jgi:hypothetical protein